VRFLPALGAFLCVAGPALAVDQSTRQHLEHLAPAGIGTPVQMPASAHERQVAQAPAPIVPSTSPGTRSQQGTVSRAAKKPQRPSLRVVAERQGYKRVSSLVNFPNFFPGIGVVYVKPATLPVGPFLSFDRKDRLVSTIYMLSLEQMNEHRKFDADRSGIGGKVDHVTVYYNGGHPGVDMPHYHYVLWHVSKKNEAIVAR
jgi:hypothetical protein